MPKRADATGDVVVGDRIRFRESVYGGSYRNPKHLGERTIEAEVIRDSYGAAKQQHTFSLLVIACDGTDPVAVGKKIRRKGRNVYRNGVSRELWADESLRGIACDEKHRRGDCAREARSMRERVAQ